MSTQTVVPTALTNNCSPRAFPACTVTYSWVKFGLLNQLLGNQGHRCVCLMCTLIFGWVVPVLGVQECSPGASSQYATDFDWCFPPALGCWPTQPHNSSQVRQTCGCCMCWAACGFSPYTVSVGGRNPNLANICQVFPDLKQPSQSSIISLSLDICKSVYFYLHSESVSTEHAQPKHLRNVYFYLGTISIYIPRKATHPSLITVLGCPLGSNLQLSSWYMC